jgi:TonB family protein
MTMSRARKVMLAAIAISVLLHLLLAGYIRWPFNQPSNENAVVTVRHITIAHIVPHTPPPATPPPTPVPTPRATPAVKAPIVPPKATQHAVKRPPVSHVIAPSVAPSAAAPAASASPAPTPTPAPTALACAQHDITPGIAATAAPVDIPPEARASKTSGTAAIQVHIDTQGHVTDASVAQSSGNAALDAVAMQMARGTTYTPALVKCKPVAAAYTFTVKFMAW